MRKITNTDLANITGIPIEGYIVESARVKNGSCSDSDHYGKRTDRVPGTYLLQSRGQPVSAQQLGQPGLPAIC